MRVSIFFLLLLAVFFSLNCEQSVMQVADPSKGPFSSPKVIYTYPPMNSKGPYGDTRAPLQSLSIRFDKIMDIHSLKKAIRLKSSLGDLNIDTNSITSIGGDVFEFRPIIRSFLSVYWRVGEIYTLTIDTSARDMNGNRLDKIFQMTFQPEPYFRVRYIAPELGDSNVPVLNSSQYLYISFNSKLDTSIFADITLSPSFSGKWYFEYDSSSIYRPLTLEVNQRYTITISSNAHDRYGNNLPQMFASTFSSSPFQVISTYPVEGASDIPLYDQIKIDFNGIIDTNTIEQSLKILPPLNYTLYKSLYYFYINPSPELFPDALYTITLDTSVMSANGNHLQSPYIFRFKTAPFMVIYTSPVNGAANIQRDLRLIYIEFNAIIDESTVFQALSFNPQIQGHINYCHSGYCYYNRFEYVLDAQLTANTTYMITLSIALRTKAGSALPSPYTFSFTTGN